MSRFISEQSPLVICGTGGSGTRVIEQFFEKSGFFMGNVMNESKDTIKFQPILGQIIMEVLRFSHSTDYRVDKFPRPLTDAVLGRLKVLLQEHSDLIPADAKGWGWKNPRFIYMLPFIQALRPDFHFIHVIRDGRDMAFSQNQNQLQLYYGYLFGKPLERFPDPVASITMWQKVNIGAANFAKRMGCKYTLIRYEDVCTKPETFPYLQRAFGITSWDTGELVSPSTSIGRYKKMSEENQQILQKAGETGLRLFGYL